MSEMHVQHEYVARTQRLSDLMHPRITIYSGQDTEETCPAACLGLNDHSDPELGDESETGARASEEFGGPTPRGNPYEETPTSGDLASWLKEIGVSSEEHIQRVMLQFTRPEFDITSRPLLFALDEDDVDDILKELPLGLRRLIKKAITRQASG